MSKLPEPVEINEVYAKALEMHRQGRPKDAISLYSVVAGHVPDAAEVHYNLGLAYFEAKQFDHAVNAYSRAAELCPGDEDIFYNLGLAYKKNNRFAQAEEAYLKALALAPADTDIHYNLGCCYRDAGEIEHACRVFSSLAEAVPDHLPSLNNLAYLLHLEGEYEQARNVYSRIVELDPDHASARYMHSVLIGSPVDVPPQEYIRSLFDHYSETFEENLTKDLEYKLYLDLRAQFDSIRNRKRIFSHGLDLGCGTGLAGEAFRTACVKLSGVDLSAKMLEQAKAKQIYNALHLDDIAGFLNKAETVYDLFIAADVLIYRGELHSFFAAAAGRSTPDALFCLSTEKSENDDWKLRTTGRYAHHPEYVEKTAAENGWTKLLAVNINSRWERDSWIKGNLFIFSRKG
ncbi:MAG: tetratricopeptide repeat protein [Desulfobulbaceae bacterium]|nr:tetratricopeptide repeat protein [Desulfobulbaceae bacterium]